MARIGAWLLDHNWALETLFWLCVASAVGLLLLAAYVVLHLGRRVGNAIAIRWHIRQLIRHAQDYANHPGARALLNDIRENREETP